MRQLLEEQQKLEKENAGKGGQTVATTAGASASANKVRFSVLVDCMYSTNSDETSYMLMLFRYRTL